MAALSASLLLLTVKETAELLRCHRAQVFKLIKAGSLQTAPKVAKKTLILRASLLAFIESNPPRVTQRAPRKPKFDLGDLDGLRIE